MEHDVNGYGVSIEAINARRIEDAARTTNFSSVQRARVVVSQKPPDKLDQVWPWKSGNFVPPDKASRAARRWLGQEALHVFNVMRK